MPFVKTWMDLKDFRLSEISQIEKDKYHLISLICGIFFKKAHRYSEQIDGCKGRGWGKMGEGGQKVQTSSFKISK